MRRPYGPRDFSNDQSDVIGDLLSPKHKYILPLCIRGLIWCLCVFIGLQSIIPTWRTQQQTLLRLQRPSAAHWSAQPLQHHADWTATVRRAAPPEEAAPLGYYGDIHPTVVFTSNVIVSSACVGGLLTPPHLSGLWPWRAASVSSNSPGGSCVCPPPPPSTITDARTRRFGFFHRLSLPSRRQAMTGCDTPATGSSSVPCTEPCPSASPGDHRVPPASAPPSAISSAAAPVTWQLGEGRGG